MKFTYLLINFLTVLFPLLLSFDKRVRFFRQWKHVFPALIISGLIFLGWDYLFTITNVWSFNPNYVLGIYFLNLPIEEILFFLSVPFACMFIYECLNFYVKKDLLKDFELAISATLLIFSALMLVLFYERVYTLVTFFVLSALITWLGFISKKSYLSRFYLAYLVSVIPFLLVNGILTSLPVVIYNNVENAATRVGTIPVEDFFYSMALLLLNVSLFEHFRKRALKRK